MRTKLSVIIPVYNVERYLRQCIDSVIGQSYENLEIILVNDESPDSSGKICDEYAAKDSRIKVFHQKNGGVSSARNTGIKAATGDYITFVDSDDWLEKEMYAEMISAAEKNTADVVMCDFANVKETATEKISAPLREGAYDKEKIINEIYPTLIVTEDFGRLPIVSACTCLFKNDLIKRKQVNFDEDLRYSEDYLFMAAVMVNAQSFLYLKNYYFYNYRQLNESRSKKYQPQWWDILLLLNIKLVKLLSPNRDYDFSRQLKLQLLHSVLLVSSRIHSSTELRSKEKLRLLDDIFNTNEVESAFHGLKLQKKPLSLSVILFLMKNKMQGSYMFFQRFVSLKSVFL